MSGDGDWGWGGVGREAFHFLEILLCTVGQEKFSEHRQEKEEGKGTEVNEWKPRWAVTQAAKQAADPWWDRQEQDAWEQEPGGGGASAKEKKGKARVWEAKTRSPGCRAGCKEATPQNGSKNT